MHPQAPMFKDTFQRWPVRVLNERMAKNGKAAAVLEGLTSDNLLNNATKQVGCSNFGDPAFREPMELLLEDIRNNADYHFVGSIVRRRFVMAKLLARLHLKKALDGEPGIAQRPVSRPVIVLGLPRTGTTRLMRILSRDPAHRPLRTWEAMLPAPPPSEGKNRFDKRRIISRIIAGSYNVLAPEFQVIHPLGVDLPEECVLLHATSFDSWMLPLQDDAPRYQHWFLRSGHAQAYKEHKLQLQTLQWLYSRDRWLLKSPGHMFGIEELMKTYPDALIIQTHRDPARVLPSIASLAASMRGMALSQIDEIRVGAQVLEQMEVGIANLESYVPKIPDDQYISIQYRDIVADPARVVKTIYERFNLDLSPEAEAAFADEIVQNPKDKKGRHHYTMEQFGYTSELLEERFHDYVGANNIPTE